MNDFEYFGEEALMMFSVKNVPPMAGFDSAGQQSFSLAEARLNILSAPKMLIK
jgi:hypothetical protein